MTVLREAVGGAPFIFVVGKGGVGKTTAAGALALELADAGAATHLISTDPAHSLGDLFHTAVRGPTVTPCSARLVIEEFDAEAYAQQWLEHAGAAVTEIMERGTWLDAEDVAGFTRLALPGVDELMAVLRLVDLASGSAQVVVDTAPTGHTLRLLDAAHTHELLASALHAMAAKASAVASTFAGRVVKLAGESLIEELDSYVHAWRARVLEPAAFVLVTRDHPVVAAETSRLAAALQERRLRGVATVRTGAPAAAVHTRDVGSAAGTALAVPILRDPAGCDGLRAWREALTLVTAPPAPAVPPAAPVAAAVAEKAPLRTAPAVPWLRQLPQRLLVLAGKGGVGKTTCAAAAALTLAADRRVLLCSADPAGSLSDVLGADGDGANLRVVQIDAAARLEQLRTAYRTELLEALESLGIGAAAAMDRRVIESLWELTPPGIDEFAALAWILDAAEADETVVLDTAPTGHFLRLLQTPQLALDWVRHLMRLIVKYRATATAGGAAEALLRTARELRALQELLHDRGRAGVIVVTLPEPLVQAETARLRTALQEAEVAVLATLLNRSGLSVPAAGTTAAASGTTPDADGALLVAPEREPPPVGADALRDFAATWKIVL